LIELVQITKSYVYGEHKLQVLKGINLHIPAGTFLAIMGPSGSGKSTLLNILGCLERPDSGEYYLDGVLVDSIPPVEWAHLRNEKIGFVFQQFNLLQNVSLLENVNLPALYRRGKESSRKTARHRAVKLLHSVGLHGFEDYIPSKISGGQQQRVAIARALLNDPVILLADEPTGNLDVQSSLEIMNIFQRLNGQGKTIIMVTHDPDIAEHASRTITITDGRITRDQFVDHPRIAALELEPAQN
jgi:putative ABC transport system ATP-binding protein